MICSLRQVLEYTDSGHFEFLSQILQKCKYEDVLYFKDNCSSYRQHWTAHNHRLNAIKQIEDCCNLHKRKNVFEEMIVQRTSSGKLRNILRGATRLNCKGENNEVNANDTVLFRCQNIEELLSFASQRRIQACSIDATTDGCSTKRQRFN